MSSHLEKLPSVTGNLGGQVLVIHGLPTGGGPYQVLVTDENGTPRWADRTHYVHTPLFDINWDGNMEGHTQIDMTTMGYEGFFFVRVSDTVYSLSDLTNSAYCWNNGEKVEVGDGGIDAESWPGLYAVNNEVLIVYDEAALNEMLAPAGLQAANGIYFLAAPAENMYVTRFTSEITVRRLDSCFLPDIDYLQLVNRPVIYQDPVRYDAYQALSEAQKGIARRNIGTYSQAEVDAKLSGIRELPAVSADDNGKFLQVADGVWTAVAITSAEEAVFGD